MHGPRFYGFTLLSTVWLCLILAQSTNRSQDYCHLKFKRILLNSLRFFQDEFWRFWALSLPQMTVLQPVCASVKPTQLHWSGSWMPSQEWNSYSLIQGEMLGAHLLELSWWTKQLPEPSFTATDEISNCCTTSLEAGVLIRVLFSGGLAVAPQRESLCC